MDDALTICPSSSHHRQITPALERPFYAAATYAHIFLRTPPSMDAPQATAQCMDVRGCARAYTTLSKHEIICPPATTGNVAATSLGL